MGDSDEVGNASQRARLSLDGLSVGDGFGQRFFYPWVAESATSDNLPDAPWHYTDDTEMAMAIVQVLERRGEIDRDDLARTFADRYIAEPGRGYGGGARDLLTQVSRGTDWKTASHDLFDGQGSFGNGGAMRAGPLGAWFADNVETTIEQATLSAEVTHSHVEGIVGAVAVALAAGWAWRWASSGRTEHPSELLNWVAEHVQESEVRSTIQRAASIPLDSWPFDVANELGCGEKVVAQDTVAFSLWMAAANLTDYCEAQWTTARVGGDVDTTCAIVGSIVALSVGQSGIPDEWLRRREPLGW